LEKWVKAGYKIMASPGYVGLKIPFGSRDYSLAIIRFGVRVPSPLVFLEWEGLRRLVAFPSKAVDRFQREVVKIAAVNPTESTARLEITPEFETSQAQQLIKALVRLAKSVEHEKVQPVQLVTPPNIEATLSAVDVHARRLFSRLIQGWKDGGGIIYCPSPGRIYLKMHSGEHQFGQYGKRAHNFKLVALAAPKGKRGPSITVTWDLARGDFAYLDMIPEQVSAYEELVSKLPGFERKGTITFMEVSDSFQEQHVEALLKAMLELKDAEQRARET
jgi:hypothetical protein